jgi:hypothetical protein
VSVEVCWDNSRDWTFDSEEGVVLGGDEGEVKKVNVEDKATFDGCWFDICKEDCGRLFKPDIFQ